MLSDNELLRCYAADRSESAFAELVLRHANMVYAAAVRQLNGDADLARDVAQLVFADLARKGDSLVAHRSLAGWLYTSARFAASKVVRSEQRRQLREQQASIMQTVQVPQIPTDLGSPAPALDTLIDDAMDELDEADREAVLLRHLEGLDFKSVGSCLGISDEAARKRVGRALDRLRTILEQRGVPSTESALAAALSGAAALTCPGDLHAALVSSALTATVQATTPLAGTLAPWAGFKTAVALTALLLGLGGAMLVQRNSMARLRDQNALLSDQLAASLGRANEQAAAERALSEQLAQLQGEHMELLRLRGEVTRLRRTRSSASAAPSTAASLSEEAPIERQQVSIEAKFLTAPGSLLTELSRASIGLDIAGAGVTAILTDEQLKKLIRAFESMPGFDVLAMPRVTTLHNRAASLSVQQTADSAGTEPLGPSVDLLPMISPDRRTVQLQASARLTERVTVPDAGGTERKQVRQTAVSGNGVLWDGQTLVLCQRRGEGKDSSSAAAANPEYVVVLATPTLIDAAGNRLQVSQETATAGPP